MQTSYRELTEVELAWLCYDDAIINSSEAGLAVPTRKLVELMDKKEVVERIKRLDTQRGYPTPNEWNELVKAARASDPK